MCFMPFHLNITHQVLDAMGHIFLGLVHPVGRNIRPLPWYLALALAWSARCNPGRWIRNDFVTSMGVFFFGKSFN